MLRRPLTTLKLTSDDVSGLIAELEDQKLQQMIDTQRKNVMRSSTRIDGVSGTVQLQENERSIQSNEVDETLDDPIPVDSFIHASPLDNKNNSRLEQFGQGLNISLDNIDPSATSDHPFSVPQQSRQNPTNNAEDTSQSNPFYRA
ncbi:Anaphase-promoting complex APC subunit CDC26 [Nakaseomyces bracarensis]|uniref:Anaphase-promoting complex APC subunit CDC26 n=1 Tax=Nakaseomyces bracarensis TaxID=273131 RepID=A0ABR4NW40_9SACH